jgi:hypothetical protein
LRTLPGGGNTTAPATAGNGAEVVPLDADVRAGGLVAFDAAGGAVGVVLEHPASTLKPVSPVHSA